MAATLISASAPSRVLAERSPLGMVLCLSLPSSQLPFQDSCLVGHPSNLEALQSAGAKVEVIRACCMCQGKRLSQEGRVSELLRNGRTLDFSCPQGGEPEELARTLTHLRCWIEMIEEVRFSAPLIIIEANASLPASFMGQKREIWAQKVLNSAISMEAQGLDFLSLSASQSSSQKPRQASGYILSAKGLAFLSKQRPRLQEVLSNSDLLISGLLKASSHFRGSAVPLLSNDVGVPSSLPADVVPPPCLLSGKPRSGMKVIVISLPVRADRRVEPLVGGAPALQAMRDSGCDVEVLRASCYCERDALIEHGVVNTFFHGLQWGQVRRYEGAEDPMDEEEAEELLSNINSNYLSGSNRLIDPEDGDVEGFVVDTNWPGATPCAMSHIRALIQAAVEGYEFALIFEDDAVIPTKVARERGWCNSDRCEHDKMCYCADAWGFCVSEALQLMQKAQPLDCLYLGLGEPFERPGQFEGLLQSQSSSRGFWPFTWLTRCSDDAQDSDEEDLGGVTEIGYTWCAQAILYGRSALQDVLRLKLHELLWAQDETIPHLYGRHAWNNRFVHALKKAGWERKWIAGAPSNDIDDGWVEQLEKFTKELDNDLGLGTAWRSSNSEEF
eukprot:TRINITY_DN69365_c0_g1_i1.p1 TRINITY_DN69365_c0_g1~~TRINITY_DN69365_c0_g1_i1.p1  ORF type:complete len:629 (+),score=114.09 TRINITY_DN69365_c0_g1_i1:48-1889(+)